MEFKDYYATLGVTKTATDAEIKKAYRKLAREHHPDLNPGNKSAEARFKEINEANEVLGDSEKRRKYDELGANWRAYEQQGAGPGAAPWTQAPGAGGVHYRSMSPDEMRDMFGADDPFSDFFHTFFGGAPAGQTRGGRGSKASRAARGHDLETVVELTLDEALAGTTRRLVTTQDGKERSVEVRIPAGVKDGARVRAAGEGTPGQSGGAAGDLYLTVRLRPHSRFERKDADLYTRVRVPVTTGVLGGEIDAPLLGGGTVRVKVPPLTSNGRVFRLRGHGMPTVGKADRGDLYVTVEVDLPTRLSDDARTHWEALKKIDEERS